MFKWLVPLALFLLIVGASFGCGSSQPRRDPTGEMFPSVVGTSLDGDDVQIPSAFAGAPVVLLIGYEQDSQFDIDRWLLGLTETKVDVALYEIPTIPGLAPRIFSGMIDGGMRKGIPSEDWGSVITVYGDGSDIVDFTGNENALPGRIMLLDGSGRVVYFHDRGYSVGALRRLRDALVGLSSD